jgi:coenzyme F420-dependent glucose-6-phosphate dehydrogenase
VPDLSVEYVPPVEQYAPADALACATRAVGSGFDGVFLTDRFQPWLPAHGSAPFAWALAGALAPRPGALTVSAVPGYRMHAAAVAQASMTVAAVHPGTHTLVLSAGDAIDEHVVGGYWPEGHERVARLIDAADAVRKLFSTVRRRSDVRHSGPHHTLETARLWLPDAGRPRLLLWAGGPVTARRAAAVADGIVVSAASTERMSAVIRAAREGAASAGRDPKGLAIATYAQLCWAPTEQQAEEAAVRDWPMAGMRFPRGDIRSPFDVEHLARSVTVDDVRSRIPVSADPDRHASELARLIGLGVDSVYVHNVAREQDEWIDVFGARIRPALDAASQGGRRS